MNLERLTKIKKQKIDVIQFAFRMSEVRQTLYANNWQEKVSTLFLKEEIHWDNFCLMVNLRDQTEERIFATGFHASVVLSVMLGRLLNGGMKENPSTREVWKTKTRITASTCIWRTIQIILLDGNKCLFLLQILVTTREGWRNRFWLTFSHTLEWWILRMAWRKTRVGMFYFPRFARIFRLPVHNFCNCIISTACECTFPSLGIWSFQDS